MLIRLVSRDKQESNKSYELVKDVVRVIPYNVEHVTIPVIAFYKSDEQFIVRIGTETTTIMKVVKLMNWVPLFKDRFVIYPPGTTMVIEPVPRSVVVFRLEPKD
jgi:hypothetical protein